MSTARGFCVKAFHGPAFLLLSILCMSTGAEAASNRPPNIVLIVADDQGYHDLGVQGATDIKTPNIDQLAAEGVRFTQAYVTCPVCSPSRAGLLTGRYQVRFGHEFNPGPNAPATFGLPAEERTIANYLKDAGYATGLVGKWHLGYRPELQPTHRGFDSFFGFLGGNHSYVPKEPSLPNNEVRRDTTVTSSPPYLTTAFNSEAVQFIDKNHERPFFLYLAYNAIHTPLQSPPGTEDRFANISPKRRQTMARMLSALDDGVGEMMAKLKEHHLEENTLVFYVSDNGGPTPTNGSQNDPLRGFKGGTLEGGIRVPMIWRWPGRLPAGKVYDKPVITLDVLPTTLAAVGTTVPKSIALDGVDLLPYLAGTKSGDPHDTLFWRYGSQFAVRRGDWKLVQTFREPRKLYNLANDIAEKQDLSSSSPDKLRELQAAFDEWNKSNVPPRWAEHRQAEDTEADSSPAAPRRGGRARGSDKATSAGAEAADE
jgi:arylsulfatase A-like enzyme